MSGARPWHPGQHGAVFGFAGWSGSGKTTLVEKIISHVSAGGVNVASIKHAHHLFDADHAGKDSFRHREAGARQVLVSSVHRSAHFIEYGDRGETDLAQLLEQLLPAELVLVEGFKSYPIEKMRYIDHQSANRVCIQMMIWWLRLPVMKTFQTVHCHFLTWTM